MTPFLDSSWETQVLLVAGCLCSRPQTSTTALKTLIILDVHQKLCPGRCCVRTLAWALSFNPTAVFSVWVLVPFSLLKQSKLRPRQVRKETQWTWRCCFGLLSSFYSSPRDHDSGVCGLNHCLHLNCCYWLVDPWSLGPLNITNDILDVSSARYNYKTVRRPSEGSLGRADDIVILLRH